MRQLPASGWRRFAHAWITAIAGCMAIAGCAAIFAPPHLPPVTVTIVAINDFHGNLQSPGNFSADGQAAPVVVGGVDYLAAYVDERVSRNSNHVIVGAGDLVGASPLISAAYHDEGTVEAMNLLGLEFAVVGNHEFDAGPDELSRKQRGGCLASHEHTCLDNSAYPGRVFPGATYQYLAANVISLASGRSLFPAYAIKIFDGLKVGFIGVTLRDTPSIVLPDGVAGLVFADEASTVNALVPELHAGGVNAIVVLIHQGGVPFVSTEPEIDPINQCTGQLGNPRASPILSFVAGLDDAVDLVISAHTHAVYNCRLPNASGRSIPVTQASAFGRVLTDIEMTLDRSSGRAIRVAASNVLISHPEADRPQSPVHPFLSSANVLQIRRLVADYSSAVAPIANQPIGAIAAPVMAAVGSSGAQPAGELVADAQLAITASAARGGAKLSFVNSGGVRGSGIENPNAPYPQEVTYQQAFTLRPFGNTLTTVTLTAQDIKDLLEQQFAGCLGQTADSLIQVSNGMRVEWSATSRPCEKIVNVTLTSAAGIDRIVAGGVVAHPANIYRVTVDSFLSAGKGRFTALLKGKDALEGPRDVDAVVAYMRSRFMAPNSPYDPASPELNLPRQLRLP